MVIMRDFDDITMTNSLPGWHAALEHKNKHNKKGNHLRDCLLEGNSCWINSQLPAFQLALVQLVVAPR
jgi:hypothetical protein